MKMGYVGIRICDMCGKRSEKLYGRLTLTKNPSKYYLSPSTVKSWALCKTCLNKLTAMQTTGDKLKEEIELKLDQVRVKNNKLELLE